MSTSLGDNKRKVGATSSAVTEARRRHTIAQSWDFSSKQPKAVDASIVVNAMARNAGNQTWEYASKNGYEPPLYVSGWRFAAFTYNTAIPTVDAVSSFGTRDDSLLVSPLQVQQGNSGTIVPGITSSATALFFSGYFRAPVTGTYYFAVGYNDSVEIYLNGIKIVNVTGSNGTTYSSTISLIAGMYYPIYGMWSNASGSGRFSFNNFNVDGTVYTTSNWGSYMFSLNDNLPVQLPSITSGWRFVTYTGNTNSPSMLPAVNGLPSNNGRWGTRDLSYIATLGVGISDTGVIVPNTAVTQVTLLFTGYFRAPITGSYVFHIISDDGIQILLNGTAIINVTGTTVNANATAISLTQGQYYPIYGLWANGGGPGNLQIDDIKVDGSSILGTYKLNELAFK